MNIVVGISRVPDTVTKIKVGGDGKSIDEAGVKFILNPYDEYAVEEGLRLREKHGGSVTVVCVGNDSAKETLRTPLAMGVDAAVLVKGDTSDSFTVAQDIAAVAKENSADVVILGRQSIDYDSFQMAPMVAEILGQACITTVSQWEINGTDVSAERDIEGGKETVSASLPIVVSAQKGLNEPRYPKLPAIMKAKKKPIAERDSVGGDSRVEIVSMTMPAEKGEGKILGDSAGDVAELVRLLREEAKVI